MRPGCYRNHGLGAREYGVVCYDGIPSFQYWVGQLYSSHWILLSSREVRCNLFGISFKICYDWQQCCCRLKEWFYIKLRIKIIKNFFLKVQLQRSNNTKRILNASKWQFSFLYLSHRKNLNRNLSKILGKYTSRKDQNMTEERYRVK